jgi:hypothetical protein
VASNEFRVRARIQAVDEASPVVDKVQSRFAKFGEFLSSRFVITFGDVTRVIRGIASAFSTVIDAAAEAEQANKRLTDALAPLGAAAQGVAEALSAQADALQKTTRFGDEAIKEGQALLAAFVQNEDQLKAATQAAVDFATVLGVDLRTAFLALAKASQGNTAAFGKYGIIIDEAVPKSERFAEVLTLIGEKFGGRAQQDARTFAGTLDQIKNSLGELAEAAGKAVTENQDITASMRDLHKVLVDQGTVDAVSNTAEAFVELGSAMLKLNIERARALNLTLAELSTGFTNFVGLLRSGGSLEDGAETTSVAFERMDRALDELLKDTTLFGASASDAAAGLSAIGAAAGDTAAKVKDAATQFEALEAAASTLGEVTSVQLANQILQINLALIAQRDALGATSAEYLRLETVAGEKIRIIQERIESLRDGLGDVATKSNEAAVATGATSQAFDDASSSARQYDSVLRTQVVNLASVERQAWATSAALQNVIMLQQLGGGSTLTTTSGGAPNGDEAQRFVGFSTTGGVYREYWGSRGGAARASAFGVAPGRQASRFVDGYTTYR